MELFSQSLHFDRRLEFADIEASIAHARMLGKQGIISKAEAGEIIRGLKLVEKEIEDGAFPYRPELEDIHMNIERRLTELIGPVGGKLHTGRSRNDQVAADLRIWLKEHTTYIVSELIELLKVIAKKVQDHQNTLMPGYTHLQHAQPVTLAMHFNAYEIMLLRDLERFLQCADGMDVMPLGAGALAGSTLPLDPASVARELGFKDFFLNSIDAVSDRDFVAEFIFVAALCQVHLSRLAEELVLWSTSEFGFVELPEEFTTGSSIMPQKRNPDSAELIRGKTGRMVGNLVTILTVLKGLPLAYNRDLQEDKEPLFDSVNTLSACLRIMRHVIDGLKINKDRLREALKDGYIEATDIAEYLVRKGMPFREAHEVVGNIVAEAVARGVRLPEMKLDEYRKFSGLFEADLFEALDFETSILLRNKSQAYGSGGKKSGKKAKKKK